MRRLTVLQLLPALGSGGVERATLEIAAALVQAGHRSIVISAGGRLVVPLTATGSDHITLDIGAKSLASLRHVPRPKVPFSPTPMLPMTPATPGYPSSKARHKDWNG